MDTAYYQDSSADKGIQFYLSEAGSGIDGVGTFFWQFNSNGDLELGSFDPAPSNTTAILPLDQWVRLQVTYVIGATTVEISIDGVSNSYPAPDNQITPVPAYDGLLLRHRGGGTYRGYVDAFAPEPASLSLVGLGGLMMSRRRRGA